jgi:hypothetical protein
MAIGYVPMQEQTLIVQKQLVRRAQEGHRATQIENSIMRTGYTVVEDLEEQDDLNWARSATRKERVLQAKLHLLRCRTIPHID